MAVAVNARIRGIPEGRDSTSFDRHYDITNSGDLLDKVTYAGNLQGGRPGRKSHRLKMRLLRARSDAVLWFSDHVASGSRYPGLLLGREFLYPFFKRIQPSERGVDFHEVKVSHVVGRQVGVRAIDDP